MQQKPTIAQIVVPIQISHCSENCVHCLLFLENSLQELKKEMYSSCVVAYSGIPFLSCNSIHLGTCNDPAGQGSFQKHGKVGQ